MIPRLRLTAVGAVTALATAASATARAQSAPAPAAATAGLRGDLTRFRDAFLAVDLSYPAPARREAEERLARLEAAVDTVSAVYFELELARIVALADNGHTVSPAGPRSRRYERVAIRLVPFGEDFYVLRAKAGDADLLGARLIAIEGRPIAEARALSRTLMGGTDAWRDRSAGYFFESPAQMQALGLIAQSGAATYAFELADGRRVTRRLTAEPADSSRPRGSADRWLYPAPAAGEGDAWRSLLDTARTPWAFQDGALPFRWRLAADLDAMLIQFRANRGTDQHPLPPFLRAVEERLRQARPRHIVLDMRQNGGGDLTTTRDFMRLLPTLVEGRVFVLTSPWTFSAAISSVGYLKQAAPERVTIVGEMVGDRLEFWAEGRLLELPHSRVMLLPATQRHDYRTGCRPFPNCHVAVVRQPISVPTLAPDIPAAWTLEAYRAGRDPGMEAVAAAIRAIN